jgi:lipoprotein-releasing system ATP-binding protein
MIQAIGLKKSYNSINVLKGINLNIEEGEIISIVGASGAGKTTLLHILGTLDKADEGKLIINNIEIDKLSSQKVAAFRNKNIGFVFQFHHLLPEFNALENVCLPAFLSKTSRNEAEKKAKELLDFLNLSDRLYHKPSQLSGGEQQRVAVARALINNPIVVFADEPSGNLDSIAAKELHKLFFTLRDAFHTTFVIVTHNPEFADMADKKLTIKDGMII